MPQLAVAPIAAWLGGSALATAAAHLVVGVGTSLIASALMGKAQGGGRADVKLQVEMGDDLPLSFCVGEFATAGKRKYIGSWGKNRRFITEVIEYSCLPQGLAGFWVNDERGAYIGNRRGYVAASATPGAVSAIAGADIVPAANLDLGRAVENLRDNDDTTDPRIWVKVVPGTQTAADPYLVWAHGADPDYPWTSAHVGRGKSYVIVTTQYDDDTLTVYPTWLWEPAPLPMYDPRKDGSTGGTGAHRWGNRATYEPTTNAALIAYNVARGIYWQSEWVFGGQNRPAWSLPRAAWVAAMAACDASVALAGGGSEPAYRAGLEILVDRPAADVLDALGLAANMRFAEVGGRIKPLVDLPAASAFSLDDSEALVTEGQSAAPFAPLSAVFNTLGATYPAPVAKWASTDAPHYADAATLAADGGRHLPTSVSYEAAPYPHQVQRLMRAQLRDYRRERRHQIALPPAAMALEPVVDLLAYTSARNGYAGKHFLIEQAVRTMAMTVTLSLREVDPADYDWSPAWELPVSDAAPVALVPWVQSVSGFTALGVAIEDGNGAARRAGIRLSCDGSDTGVREIWVQVRQPGATLLEHDGPFDFVAPHQWLVPNLIGDTAYQVRARLISTLTPRSLWTAWVDVTTPDVRVGLADLDAEVAADLDRLHDWIDAGVDDLPQRLLDQATAYRQLVDQMRDVAGEAIDQAARAHVVATEGRVYQANAEQSLIAKIGMTDDQVLILAQAITALQAAIPGLATASALQALTATVATQGNAITGVASDVTALQTAVAGKADASALSSLSGTVSSQGNTISSQGSAITSLQNTVNHATTGLATKASTTALNALSGSVMAIDGEVGAIASALTQLGAISGAGTAQTIMKMQAESSPSGVLARIGLKALVGDSSDNARVAAIFLEALAGGESRVVVQADRFIITDGSGRKALFSVVSGNIYISGDLIAPNSATRSVGNTRDATNVVTPAPLPGMTNLTTSAWTIIYGPITWPSGTFLPVDSAATWGEWRKGAFDLYLEANVYNWDASKKLAIDFMIERQKAAVWSIMHQHRHYLNVSGVPVGAFETVSHHIPNMADDLTGAGALRMRACVSAPNSAFAATGLVENARCFIRQANL